jgi:hypothetical protein
MLLQVMPAPYQLPTALFREVVLPGADGLLILGGRMFVLGGGTASSAPTVQAFTQGTQAAVVGQLGRARSDSGGVSAGPVGYVVGGYDGTILDPQVLATTDGRHFRVAARLPVPVRYAATAAVAGLIWVFGGETAAGATDAIQRVDPATGAAAVVGHLPQPVQGAAVISLDGRIYVAGGATAHGTSRAVFRFDPATFLVSAAGELPVPAGYAAAVTSGGIGYLIGGEDGAHPVPAVTTFRLVWQYGHTGVAGQSPGYLSDPDGVDLVPPDSLLVTHAATMGQP